MTQLTNALKSVTRAGTFDHIVLLASVVFIAVVALQIHSTIAAVSVDVAISEVATTSR